MWIEALSGALATIITGALGWIIKKINEMQHQINDHAKKHVTRQETAEIVQDKTDYLQKSFEEVKAQLKDIQDTLTGITRWQGRQEGKEKNQKD